MRSDSLDEQAISSPNWTPDRIEFYSTPELLCRTMRAHPEHAARCRSHAATLLTKMMLGRRGPLTNRSAPFLMRLLHRSDAESFATDVDASRPIGLVRSDLNYSRVTGLRFLCNASALVKVYYGQHITSHVSAAEICAVRNSSIVETLYHLPWAALQGAVLEDTAALRVHLMPWFGTDPKIHNCLMNHEGRPHVVQLGLPGLPDL